MNKSKRKKGTLLPKSPRPADGVSLFNLPKYLISPLGVYSLCLNRFLKGCKGSKGYLQVWLVCADGLRRWFSVHRLIAQAFLPNPNNLPVAHHRNHNKLCNDLSNLEWASYAANTRFAIEAGRRTFLRGPQHPRHGTKVSDTTKEKMSEGKRGIKNPKCRGPYYLNGIEAETLKELSELTGTSLSEIKRLNKDGELKGSGKKYGNGRKVSEIFAREQAPTLAI